MAEKKKGFDLASVLADVSELDTITPGNREQIEYIDIDLFDDDPNNFYELSEIDGLAANIELIGLQQPLRVRTNPEELSRVMITSGHRRRAAIRKLVDEGREDLRKVACIREAAATSGALQELRLIYANSDTRLMSSSDTNKQAERVEALLYQLKEEGYEFPGRMRDHVAEACKVSKTKLARLKVIRDNLLKEWKNFYEKGDLTESSAYALAKLPTAHQIAIFNYRNSLKENPAKSFYYYTIKSYGENLAKIDTLTCKKNQKAPCTNMANKYQKMMSISYEWQRDCCNKCCDACEYLAKCKYACPALADKVKKLKADAKADRQHAKAAEEERQRPLIEQLQKLWYRFGVARAAAGKSIKDVYTAATMSYSKSYEKEFKDKEDLFYNFKPETKLPYSYYFDLDDANRLIRMADLLGCSLDYLFCRTDNPGGMTAPAETTEPAAPAPGEILPATWYPASVDPPIDKEIIIVTHNGFTEDCLYYGAGTLSENAVSRWNEVALWSLLPSSSNAALAGTRAPLVWIDENPAGPVDAVVKFSLSGVTLRKLAHWDGRFWKFRSGAVIEAESLKWYPIPDDKEETNGTD